MPITVNKVEVADGLEYRWTFTPRADGGVALRRTLEQSRGGAIEVILNEDEWAEIARTVRNEAAALEVRDERIVLKPHEGAREAQAQWGVIVAAERVERAREAARVAKELADRELTEALVALKKADQESSEADAAIAAQHAAEEKLAELEALAATSKASLDTAAAIEALEPCVTDGKVTRRAEIEIPGGFYLDRCLRAGPTHEGDHEFLEPAAVEAIVAKLREV